MLAKQRQIFQSLEVKVTGYISSDRLHLTLLFYDSKERNRLKMAKGGAFHRITEF